MNKWTDEQIVAAYKAGFIEAAKWPHVCTQDADSRAVDDAARKYADTLDQPQGEAAGEPKC